MFRCAINRHSRRPLILTTHPIVVFGSSAAGFVTSYLISSPEAAALSGSGVFTPTSIRLLQNGSLEATDGNGASIVIGPDKFVLLSDGAVLIAQELAFAETDLDQVSPAPQPVLSDSGAVVETANSNALWSGGRGSVLDLSYQRYELAQEIPTSIDDSPETA